MLSGAERAVIVRWRCLNGTGDVLGANIIPADVKRVVKRKDLQIKKNRTTLDAKERRERIGRQESQFTVVEPRGVEG